MPPPSVIFDAVGTRWEIETESEMTEELTAAVRRLVDRFDRDWSRFRDDSLVARIGREPGRWRLPAEAGPLFELYRTLYEATGGMVSPLVGRSLEVLGYDSAYTLRPTGPARPAPRWEDAIAWDGEHLTSLRPLTIDVGAAGKGLLVDLVMDLLVAAGVGSATVDAGGDIRHRGDPVRVALEHPLDPGLAVGVVTLPEGALCASAVNRRAWEGLHHVIDATTGRPVSGVLATWVLAERAMVADGLATALFFVDPSALDRIRFDYVRMLEDGRVEWSPSLDGEVFV